MRIALLAMILCSPGLAAEVTVVNRDSGLPSNDVRLLAIDGPRVCLAAGRNGVALYDSGRRRVTDLSDTAPLAGKDVISLAAFQGRLYVGTSSDLTVWDGRAWDRQLKVGNVTFRNVVLAASPDGKELWASAMTLAGGTMKYDGTNWTFMGGSGRGLLNNVSSFSFGKEGAWMGSASGTVYLHTGSDVRFFREGLSGIVLAVAAAGGAAYAGTTAGLFRLEGEAWKQVPFPPEWGEARIYSMAAEGETVYLATTAGLVRLKDGKLDRLTVENGIPSNEVRAVAAGEGLVYAGTSEGLAVVRGW